MTVSPPALRLGKRMPVAMGQGDFVARDAAVDPGVRQAQ
jgi:hypothetical protein